MSAEDAATRESRLADRLASLDEALRDGAATEANGEPDLTPALQCLRMLEEVWPRHPNNAPTLLRAALIEAARPASPLAMPATIGRFHLRRELGRGGFGIVYLARDPQLHRDVALKVPRPDLTLTDELRQRFQQEARAAAGLEHSNIVPVYEAGEADGASYIASAYCPGVTLADWLKHQAEPMPFEEAALLVKNLAAGVQHAHERGVLHRDLKPANVLLNAECGMRNAEFITPIDCGDSTGRIPNAELRIPKITDFGLAKVLDQADALTKSGAAMGTPSYMAPEQAVGNATNVGRAADVYSLGVILYELLTGRPPFVAATALEIVLLARTQEPVPPSRLRHRLPADLETICLKCLEKEPGRRFASAGALADDLEHYLKGEPIRARPVGAIGRATRWARREPLKAALAAALALTLLLGVLGIGWQAFRAERNATDARRERDVAVEERLQAERNLAKARQAFDKLTAIANDMYNRPGMYKSGRDIMHEVRTFYRGVLKERSDNPEVRFQTALAGTRVGSICHHFAEWEECDVAYREAIDLLEGLVREQPENVRYRHQLARTLVSHAHMQRDSRQPRRASATYARAVDLVEELIADAPEEIGHHSYLANILLNWCTVLAGAQTPEHIERLHLRAIGLQRRALQAKPQSTFFMAELALGLDDYGEFLTLRGRAKEGLPHCREALALREEWQRRGMPVRADVRYLAFSHSNTARVLEALGQWDEAETHHRRATATMHMLARDFPGVPLFDDDMVLFRVRMGDHYRMQDRQSTASELYRAALRDKPHGAAALTLLAKRLAEGVDPKAALDLAQRATQAAPQDADTWTALGRACWRLGDHDRAVAALNQALALNERGDVEVHLLMAIAHSKKNIPAAAEHLTTAKKLADPTVPFSDDLQRLRREAEAAVNP